MPENICTEKQLKKNGRERPEEDDAEVVPRGGAEEKLPGEEKPGDDE